MTKNPYQTCLRMPLTLKEDMSNICNEYKVNESDFKRKAIVHFVKDMKDNPKESRYMFM